MRTHLYAPVFRRLAAYLINSFALFGGVLLTQAALALANANPILRLMNAGGTFTGSQLHLWVFASVSVPFWLYYALMHSSAWEATLGKRLLGLRVTTLSGERLSFGRGLLRAIAVLIPFEVNHVVLFHLGNFSPEASGPSAAFWLGYGVVWALIAAYILIIVYSPHKQGLHDLISGTIVVQTNSTLNGVLQ